MPPALGSVVNIIAPGISSVSTGAVSAEQVAGYAVPAESPLAGPFKSVSQRTSITWEVNVLNGSQIPFLNLPRLERGMFLRASDFVIILSIF